MDEKLLLTVLGEILAQPTAPFHEDSVRAKICELLADAQRIEVERDAFGNVLARYSGGGGQPRWGFGSHMDHPGWVEAPSGGLPGDGPLSAPHRQRGRFTFLGGVPERYFSAAPPIAEFGRFAMWDLPAFEVDGGRVSGRACDDLVGCAAIVTALLELDRARVETDCVGIFTRAEEVGFVGAIELARDWRLPRDLCFVSVETSVAAGDARMGAGPVCRVGDRLSIFDSDATASILSVAVDRGLPVQRALLDRGSCEATALQAYGITTAGISIPLGNYHNCGEGERIEAEFVELDDVRVLALLLRSIAEALPGGPTDAGGEQRERLEARAAGYRPFYARGAAGD